MRLNRLVILTLLLAAVTTPLRAHGQDLATLKERIDAIITSQLDKPPARLPSTVIAVVHGDKIVWEQAHGWADQEHRIAATTTTPYYLASVTKVFTGTALGLLAKQGRLDMNRSVNAYLGSHKVQPALWKQDAITVQRVADQIGGLSTFNLDCESEAGCRVESAIDRFGVIVQPPGENFNYSNIGYGILGEVIAGASKHSYRDFVRRSVFEALGMRDCAIANGAVRGAAVRYIFGTTSAFASPYSATPAAAAAYCSAHSLALFAQALLNASEWSTVLPTSGVAATQSGTTSGTMYSRGWWIDPDYVGTTSIYAQGGTPYGSAFIRLIPSERLAVIAVANTGATFDLIADSIIDDLVPAIRERRKTWAPRPAFTRQRRPISPDLVGTWTGAIDTYRGKRPLTMAIDAAGTVTGSLDGNTGITRTGASGERVFGLFPEMNLGIDEAAAGSYDVQLGLTQYGTRLVGFATTQAREGKSAPTLSFLADLTRTK